MWRPAHILRVHGLQINRFVMHALQRVCFFNVAHFAGLTQKFPSIEGAPKVQEEQLEL